MLTLSRHLSVPVSVAILGLCGTALPVSGASASRDRVATPDASLVSPDPDSWGKPDFGAFFRALKRALVRRDVAATALLIQYPLRINQDDGGRITIENARALESHFDAIFPPFVRTAIANLSEEDAALTGDDFEILDGTLWVGLTGSEKAARYRVEVVNPPFSRKQMHTRQTGLRYACETEKHLIVIDSAGTDKVRYRSWNKPHLPSDKPDLELTSDDFGTVGWHGCAAWSFGFARGDTTYRLNERSVCTAHTDDPADARATLSVAVAGRVKQSWWCY